VSDRHDGPPRAILITALVVAVAAAVAVLVVAITKARREPQQPPLAIPAVPAPLAAAAECDELLAAVPERLGDYRRATPVTPVPEGAAAWESGPGGEPIVLRCGLDAPADFVVGAPIQLVNSVQWFRVSDPADDRSTWFAVDRPVYIALTLPQASGPTPIQQMSDVIAATLPATPIRPAPPR
jgi:hypothetical protein